MERRSKIRLEVHQPILAKVLSNWGENTLLEGELENISGSGLRVISETEAPPGAAIEIELPDAMVLAEVRYCEMLEPHSLRPGVKRFAIGLEMKEVLNDMGQLAQLIHGIMGQPTPSRSASPLIKQK